MSEGASVSEALGANAAPHRRLIKGEWWTFRLFVQKDKSEFERWVYENAILATQEMKAVYGEDYFTVLKSHSVDRAANAYSWGSENVLKVLSTIHGCTKVLSMIGAREKDGRGENPAFFLDLLTQSVEGSVEVVVLYIDIFAESFGVTEEAKKKAMAGLKINLPTKSQGT